MKSSFIFGHSGKPSLSHTVCTRLPMCRREPVRSWFKTLQEFPYGGWGFYARLHCYTYLELAPVFNYHTNEAAHLHGEDTHQLAAEFKQIHSNQNFFIPQKLQEQCQA